MSSIQSKISAAVLGSVLLAGCGEKQEPATPTTPSTPAAELKTPRHLDMFFELKDVVPQGTKAPSAKAWVDFAENKNNQLESVGIHLRDHGKYTIRLYDMIGGSSKLVYEEKDITVSAAVGDRIFDFTRKKDWPGEIEAKDAVLEIRYAAEKAAAPAVSASPAPAADPSSAGIAAPAVASDPAAAVAPAGAVAPAPSETKVADPASAGTEAPAAGDPAAATPPAGAVVPAPSETKVADPASAGTETPAAAGDPAAAAAPAGAVPPKGSETAAVPAPDLASKTSTSADTSKAAPAPSGTTAAAPTTSGPVYEEEQVILLNLSEIAARAK